MMYNMDNMIKQFFVCMDSPKPSSQLTWTPDFQIEIKLLG